ncbi:MAG TPA: adenylate/guanylate cyclase domain-containing protein, partial [Spirochaetota bacterium]
SIGNVLEKHKDLTQRSVSLIFEIEKMKEPEILDAVSKMNEENRDTLSRIELAVSSINTRADVRIAQVQRYYAAIIVGGFIVGGVLFIILIIMFIRVNRRRQNEVISLSSILNSYLPSQLVLSVMRKGKDALPSISRKNLTVCFTDLEGFTAAAEGCEPEVIARILDEYLSDMATIAQSWGGMVDKFMGDGIMILFGAFADDAETHSLDCVRMAVAMQRRMSELIAKWHDDGFESPMGLRIGINTGYATIGSIGPENRRSFTAIGSVVNIASRLEKLCPPGKIMIGHDTRTKVCVEFDCQSVAFQKIKGISRTIQIYEIDPEKTITV